MQFGSSYISKSSLLPMLFAKRLKAPLTYQQCINLLVERNDLSVKQTIVHRISN